MTVIVRHSLGFMIAGQLFAFALEIVGVGKIMGERENKFPPSFTTEILQDGPRDAKRKIKPEDTVAVMGDEFDQGRQTVVEPLPPIGDGEAWKTIPDFQHAPFGHCQGYPDLPAGIQRPAKIDPINGPGSIRIISKVHAAARARSVPVRLL